MSNYFITSINSISNPNLTLHPVNLGDQYIYLKVETVSDYILNPGQSVRVVVTPSNTSYTDTDISGFLRNKNSIDNISNGMFYQIQENNNSISQYLNIPIIKIDRLYENTKFNLYWLTQLEGSNFFGSYKAGVYSYPHNIQPSEITISGAFLGNNDIINYRIYFNEIPNANSPDYPVNIKPYYAKISHEYPDMSGTYLVDQPLGTGMYFSAGNAESGIAFTVPFFDQRNGWNNVPARYVLSLSYMSPTEITIPFDLKLDHTKYESNNYIKSLDTFDIANISPSDLKKIDEILIEPAVIDRKRLSVRIQDIYIKENKYEKYGIYISKPYNMDFNIYTFSIKVDEFIPKYNDLNSEDVLKYYVEFNNRQWERISPTNRLSEYDNSLKVPKLLILDSSTSTISDNIKFINYDTSVNSFRIKIEFDLRKLPDFNFIPPEIRGYKISVFDKNKFLDL